MSQKKIKLSSIKPNPNNPRKISDAAMQKLCESIERDPQFMELRPMIVDDQNVIVGGNQRFFACQKLEMKEVPASWIKKATDLTADQIKRFILVDNSPDGMTGYWDFDLLFEQWGSEELESLGVLSEQKLDFDEEWKGMPEFDQDDVDCHKQLKVYFKTEADYLEVSDEIDNFGMLLTEKT